MADMATFGSLTSSTTIGKQSIGARVLPEEGPASTSPVSLTHATETRTTSQDALLDERRTGGAWSGTSVSTRPLDKVQVDVEKMLRALNSGEPFVEFERELSRKYNPVRRPHLHTHGSLGGFASQDD